MALRIRQIDDDVLSEYVISLSATDSIQVRFNVRASVLIGRLKKSTIANPSLAPAKYKTTLSLTSLHS